MTRTIWLNGSIVDPVSAAVSTSDAGLQHAVGLFETMLAQATDAQPQGRVFRLAEHLARLATSARELGLMSSLNTRALAEAVEATLERSGICSIDEPTSTRARVRLTITGGDLNMLAAARTPGASQTPQHDPTILIDVSPAQRYPDAMFDRGVSLVVAAAKANPLNQFESHKTLNYWWRLRELQLAASKGAGETLVLMVTNHVAGGAVSNLFAVKDRRLITPIVRGEEQPAAIPSPVLPGVTRAAVVTFADALGIPVEKRMLTIDDALDADELFLTNSSWGVLPVARVEAKPIGPGGDGDSTNQTSPGPITIQLRKHWLDAMADEL